MSEIAHEVSRRLTPRYAKERAREMARDRMYRARDHAVESSWFAPLLGAGIGALVAKALQSRAQERGWDDRSGYRGELEGGAYGHPRGGTYRGYAAGHEEYDVYGAEVGAPEEGLPGGGLGGGDTGSKLGEKAAEMKESARAKAEHVKGRIQEATSSVTSSVRERLPDRARIRASTHEDTGLWALGAMALGALFGFALPETQREREMLEPARRKAREIGQQARDKVLEKGSEAMEKATEKVAATGGEQRPQAQPGSSGPGSPEPPPALH